MSVCVKGWDMLRHGCNASPTDLTHEQWAPREPLLPPAKPGGRSRSVDRREVVNALRFRPL